ncbi:MAG: ACT domain-containing protein, partial [Oscillospiraceae bacterium]
MKAVITVVGKDTVGILAKVSTICAQSNVNVSDVTQSILQDLFVMVMLVDISKCSVTFTKLSSNLDDLGKSLGLSIKIMHE